MAFVNWEHAGLVVVTDGGGSGYTGSGATLTKSNHATWNAVAFAEGQRVRGVWSFEFVLDDPTDQMVVGLRDSTPTGSGPYHTDADLDFAWHSDGTNLKIREDGGATHDPSILGVIGDVLRIQSDGTTVTYYRNGSLVYTSLNAPRDVFYAPTAMLYTALATISSAKITQGLANGAGVECTITIEALTNAAGDVWTTIPDVIAKHGIRLQYGLPGAGLNHRVAGTGRMEFVLDNSEANNAGKVGYYSPGHANQWSFTDGTFDIGLPIRLKVVYGATTYYKFRGRIDDLDVIPGRYAIGGKKVKVRVVDWMDQASRASISGIGVQTDKRSDELFEVIVNSMTTQPAATQVGYGQDTYPYALDNTRDESISVMTEFQRLAMSEFGFIYVRGDNVQGGTLVFENRLKRGQKTAAVTTLTDMQLIAMPVSYGRDDVLNNVQVQIFPRRVDAAANTVLFTLQNSPQILAGTTLSLKGTYRDPDSGSKTRVGGTSMVTPVANTDYKLTSNEDGTGTNLTGQLTVNATYYGNSVDYSITNAGPADGYLSLLQARGKGLYSHESVLFEKEDATSQAKYGNNQARVNLPYQSDSILGEEIAYYVLAQYKNAATRVLGATFIAQDNDENMRNAILREISDRIAIEEPVTAVNTEYFINAIEWTIRPSGFIECSWLLAPASLQEYWILETDGYTELDLTTVLAYGLFAPQWQLDVSNLGVDTTVNAV